MGIELWTAEVVIELQRTYDSLKFAVITPFQGHTEKWNEHNQSKYANIIKYADYVDSIFHTSYQGPFQFKQADQFMLEHSDQTLLIYDEEQEASPKFFKQKLVDFMDKTNYTCDIVTFDELTAFINDLQWSEDQSF